MIMFPHLASSLPTVLLLAVIALSYLQAQEASPIKNVVVLTLENRSFDNLLGWLKTADVAPSTTCLPLNVSNPAAGSACVSSGAAYFVASEDPKHEFDGVTEQIFGGTSAKLTAQDPAPMNGFAQAAEELAPGFSSEVMSSFTAAQLPATTSLALEFAIVDRWFSSVPGPTYPNRFFLEACTSKGMLHNVEDPRFAIGFRMRTLFNVLQRSGISWGVFFHDVPNTLNMRMVRRHAARLHHVSKFFEAAKAGSLPGVSWVEPQYFDSATSYANDYHPPHDVRRGEQLVKSVYEALRASPLWEQSLLLITFDEHGGYYDHVPTPQTGVPSPDGIAGEYDHFQFNRLGVRVPTFVVSPWVDKGTVIHQPEDESDPTSQFEHSSIAKTVRQIFGINHRRNVLTKRDAWAASLLPFLSKRTTPRSDCPLTLPEVSLGAIAPLPPPHPPRRMSARQRGLFLQAAALAGRRQLAAARRAVHRVTEVEGGNFTRHMWEIYLHHM